MGMVIFAVMATACAMAEFGRRRARLARLCIAHHERADKCFDRAWRICKFGETANRPCVIRGRAPSSPWDGINSVLQQNALAVGVDSSQDHSTPFRSIEAFYGRQGPVVWLDYQTGLFHSAFSWQCDRAANRPWFPTLSELPPLNATTLARPRPVSPLRLRCHMNHTNKDSAMRAIVGVSVFVILAVTSVRAERLSKQERGAVEVDVAERTELGKILSVVQYDRDIGTIARIHYSSTKAATLKDVRRIYLRVKSDISSRRADLQMHESIIKSIAKGTPLRIVGAIENADSILEVHFRAARRADQ
jgi:hypothetical protein